MTGSGRRVALSPEERLALAGARRREADLEVDRAVAAARAAGVSWAHVGVALGVSGEGARKRWG